MANDVTIGIGADSSGAVKGIQEVQTGFGKMSSSFEKHRKKIAIGMTALGGGLVALAATQMKSAQAEALGIAKLDQIWSRHVRGGIFPWWSVTCVQYSS